MQEKWEDLLPCLKKGDIVVMDNLRAHHTRGAEELAPLYRRRAALSASL